MLCTRDELQGREQRILAPYAQLSAHSRGRVYPEEPPRWRTEFQRDRDRVIHSRAFRRLEYKTQVFLNGAGDHFRTRLTHSIEVAAIARNIARALQLNEDLAETIALAHDLGHPPFGHKGEAVLDRLMRHDGGFEHNRQSLRIVEELEQKYPRFPGLNLTWEVREGLAKHEPGLEPPGLSKPFKQASLEAQVANLADEIAYYSHDLDDGLEAGLLQESELNQQVEIWRQAARAVRKEHGRLPDECRRYFTIRCVIDLQVGDVVGTTEKLLKRSGANSADDVRKEARPLVRYSDLLRSKNARLRKFLYKTLYYNPLVHEPNLRAVRMLEFLFRHYSDHPDQIGDYSRKRAEIIGWPRAICDYLAGMTDRYVAREHQRLTAFNASNESGRPCPAPTKSSRNPRASKRAQNC